MLQSCLFASMACQGLQVCFMFTACRSNFPFCCKENDSDPQVRSGSDNLVCATSCQEDVTDPAFSDAFFVVFVPDSSTFATDKKLES